MTRRPPSDFRRPTSGAKGLFGRVLVVAGAVAWLGGGTGFAEGEGGASTPAPPRATLVAAEDRVPRALPGTLGWGPPLRIEQRPVHTPAPQGPGEWAGSYVLGPGDQLSFTLFGDPTTRKPDVIIAPDGTVSYLQARGVKAEGKTLPELRARMEHRLSEYHKDARLVITPTLLRSKRYTLLGRVKRSGTYPLERPTTLLEAIAQGGGFATGTTRSNVPQLADLRRSFVVRDGDKLPVDFEMLYALGDLTHNVFLEPGDYVHIASNANREFYIFGAIENAGAFPMDTPLTVTGAIAAAGGFGQKAWKRRVLVVRGNLSAPSAEVVDMRDVLNGKGRDIALQAGDIVYVHTRPWSFAEDLLDAAIRSFIQGSAAAAFETDTSISVGN